jgi:ubiquinol-cytochrome c reductase cytochrome b subunit
MALVTAMPIIGRWRAGHIFNVMIMIVMMLGIGGLTGLALYNDKTDPDFQASVKQAHEDEIRVAELAERPDGIPIEGAISLMRNDPKTQGPRIFARNCAPCHRYNGHDGTGREVAKIVKNSDGSSQRVIEPATATDLGKFGSAEWLKSVITDFKGTFAALENVKAKDGKGVAESSKHFLEGDMSQWSSSNVLRWRPESGNQESLADLVAFLQAQSDRPRRRDTAESPAPDAAAIQRGRAVFETGVLATGAIETSCIECHSLKPRGEDKVLGAGGDAPTLTGYAGADWLREFLINPGHEKFYGTYNAMPAFEKRLTPKDLDLLVRWMVGDYE